MVVEDRTSAAFGLNHPFNVGLGVPIARQSDDAQGTLAFFFREMQTKDGKPSSRILGVTNKHVACLDTTTDFQLQETDPLYILVCGNRRLALAIDDIEEKVDDCFRGMGGCMLNATSPSRKVWYFGTRMPALEGGRGGTRLWKRSFDCTSRPK